VSEELGSFLQSVKENLVSLVLQIAERIQSLMTGRLRLLPLCTVAVKVYFLPTFAELRTAN
jgi:hypothetical protein